MVKARVVLISYSWFLNGWLAKCSRQRLQRKRAHMIQTYMEPSPFAVWTKMSAKRQIYLSSHLEARNQSVGQNLIEHVDIKASRSLRRSR
ncbi:hypothetical protein BDR03DRAFT_204258 [Suillus americanus]|nr:hypothetical protein BDR03DRAFT_204258 [Suillus americanus]